MKKLLLSAFAALTMGAATAQLPANSVAPNFTATDLNGNSYTLYSLLDQGITVYLDVSATWCGPCWNYHNTHKLRDLYDQYGPTGTITPNKVMVFFAEGDGQTSLADLQGTGGNTQGNWVAGTTYPILHATGPQIANLYEINAYPTLYVICPNRIVNTFSQGLTVPQMYALAGSCPVATQPVDAGLIQYTGSPAACVGANAELRVMMQNMGTQSLASCTIEALSGGNVVASNTWNGNLGTYGTADVLVGTVPVTGNATYTFRVNAANDANANNNQTTGSYVASNVTLQGIEVRLELQLDGYAAESSWALYDGAGNTVAQAAYTGANNNQLITQTFTLNQNDCYNFRIIDSYGDGICCAYGNGFYRLVDVAAGTNIVNITGAAADFEQRDDVYKSGTGTGLITVEIDRSNVRLFPNPANDNFTLEYRLDESSNVAVTIVNALGQPIKSVENMERTAGTYALSVETSELPVGTYAVMIGTDKGLVTKMFTVVR